MKKIIFSVLFSLCLPVFAGDWQTSPTVASSSSGAAYSITPQFVAGTNCSGCTTYDVYVVDSLIPWSTDRYDVTTTTTVTLKDSSNNTICNTPADSYLSPTVSGITGSPKLYTWTIVCSSGTLTNGDTYNVNIVGDAYHYGAGTSGNPQVFVYVSGQ